MTYYKALYEGEEGAYSGKKGRRNLYFQTIFPEQEADPEAYANKVERISPQTRGLAFPKLVSLKKLTPRQYFDEQYGEGYFEREIVSRMPAHERMEHKS